MQVNPISKDLVINNKILVANPTFHYQLLSWKKKRPSTLSNESDRDCNACSKQIA